MKFFRLGFLAKRGVFMLVSFLVVGVGFGVPFSARAVESSDVIFSDDFNDNSIDSAKWTTEGTRVFEQDGVMNVTTDVTDAGGKLSSRWFPINGTQPITISRKTLQHYGNETYVGFFRMYFDTNNDGVPDVQFGLNYANNSVAINYGNNYSYCARHGIFLDNITATNLTGIYCNAIVSPVVPGIWDTWFNEELTYDPVSGLVSYRINGEQRTMLNVGALPSSVSYRMQLFDQAWGWWTGHYDKFDDISVSQSGTVIPSIFTCGISTVQDADGNTYDTTDVNGQCWMKENMRVGTMVTGAINQKNNGTIEKYCYDNNLANCSTDGGLYQWDEAMQYNTTEGAQGICPAGWHVPTDAEQYALENYLKNPGATCDADRINGSSTWDCDGAGTKMKSGTPPGLNFPLNGYRNTDGTFNARTTTPSADIWSSSQIGTSAWNHSLYSAATVGRGTSLKTFGLTVRCLRDSDVSEPANHAPVITLKGDKTMTLNVGDTFTDLGATATDVEDGDITAKIVRSGDVDTSKAGTYTITYNVKDSKDLAAEPVTRTVVVVPGLKADFKATVWNGKTSIYKIGEDISFDASNSKPSKSDVPIKLYEWLFNGANYSVLLDSNQPILKHSFEKPGEYNVQLIVTDTNNQSASISSVIRIDTRRIIYVPMMFTKNGNSSSYEVSDILRKAEYVTSYYKQQSYGLEYLGNELASPIWIKDSRDVPLKDDLDKWEIIREDIISTLKNNGIILSNVGVYDSIVAVAASIDSSNYLLRSFATPPSIKEGHVITVENEHYSTWAHELGHSIFKFRDHYLELGEDIYGGDTDQWELMGEGSRLMPTTPISTYDKVQAGWLHWDTNDGGGTHIIKSFTDPNTKPKSMVPRYNLKNPFNLIDYYIYELRTPPDNINADADNAFNNEVKSNYSNNSAYLSPETGLLLYKIEGDNNPFTGAARDKMYTLPWVGSKTNVGPAKPTLLPGENYVDAIKEVRFTFEKNGSEFSVKADPWPIFDMKIFSLVDTDVQISTSGSGWSPQITNNSYDIDLHVIDDSNRMVGMNYVTGKYEVNIPGAITSGNLPGGGPEWIAVPKGIDVKVYTDSMPAKKWAEEEGIDLPDIQAQWNVVNYDDAGTRTESPVITTTISSSSSETQTEIGREDKIAPVTTFSASDSPVASGWYTNPVIVTLSATDNDGGVGVKETKYSLDNGATWNTYIDPFTISEEGMHTIQFYSEDWFVNKEETKTSEIKIDKTVPVVVIGTPVEGTEYTLGEDSDAEWLASDAVSGMASSSGTTESGASIDTATVGEKSYTVTATDKAGNVTEKTVKYFVRYDFGGVLRPIKEDGTSVFKFGSTVPVKFQLKDFGDAIVASATASIYLSKVSGDILGTEVEAESTSSASTGNQFRYSAEGNQYIFNVSTKPLGVGTWQMRIALDDGSSKTVNFSLK